MARAETIRVYHLIAKLEDIGFTFEAANNLRRISMVLRRWYELECGSDSGCIERDEKTGKPIFVNSNTGRRWTIPDRENGAVRRLDKIMSGHPGLSYYLQTDPRGAALHILRPGDVPAGKNPAAYYTNGIAVF